MHTFPLAPRLFSFPFFSTTPSLFLSIFRGKLRGNRQILGSEPSLRLVWAQNQPNFRPNRQNAGNFAENPCIPGIYPATAWVFCRFPQFCLRFCPRPALRLRENSEFPEWSTKHPLFPLEISGNAKCWGPSVFLFVFRKTWPSPTPPYPSLSGTIYPSDHSSEGLGERPRCGSGLVRMGSGHLPVRV